MVCKPTKDSLFVREVEFPGHGSNLFLLFPGVLVNQAGRTMEGSNFPKKNLKNSIKPAEDHLISSEKLITL